MLGGTFALGAHVGKLLFFADVDRKIASSRVLTNHLTFIHRDARTQEKLAAILRPHQTEERGDTGLVRYERALFAFAPRGRIFLIAVKRAMHNAKPPRISQKFIAISKQSARRHHKLHAARAVFGAHLLHLAVPAPKLLDHHTRALVRRLDHDAFKRRHHCPVNLFINHLRPADLKLISFAPQPFYENRQMQLPAPGNYPPYTSCILHPQRRIRLKLAVQPLADLARS